MYILFNFIQKSNENEKIRNFPSDITHAHYSARKNHKKAIFGSRMAVFDQLFNK